MQRIIFYFLIIAGLYYSLISLHVFPEGEGVCASQANQIKVAAWRELKERPEVAVVGTSRTAIFRPQYFKVPVVNISLEADTALTGLALVQRGTTLPKILLVEMNPMALRKMPTESALIEETNPFEKLHKQVIDYRIRPINVYLSCLPKPGGDWHWTKEVRDNAAREVIKGKKYGVFDVPKGDKFEVLAQYTKGEIDKLRARGVNVILFDPPVDPVIDDVFEEEIATLHRYFPQDEYTWLKFPNQKFDVADLNHLSTSGAKKFCAAVSKELSESYMVSSIPKSTY